MLKCSTRYLYIIWKGFDITWPKKSIFRWALKYCYHAEDSIPVHQCSKNWDGSSKAMEPDMAISMLHKMKDSGHPVQIIHGDNDSTTSSSLKLDFPSEVFHVCSCQGRNQWWCPWRTFTDCTSHLWRTWIVQWRLVFIQKGFKWTATQGRRSQVCPFHITFFRCYGRSQSLLHRVSAAVI